MKILKELSKDYNDGNLYSGDFSGKNISFDFKLLEVSVDECSQVHSSLEADESREHIFGNITDQRTIILIFFKRGILNIVGFLFISTFRRGFERDVD